MEIPTINYSATLAKPADEGLLARLAREQNPQDGVKPYQLPPDEFRAYLEAEIDAARMPWARGNAHRRDEPGEDEELVDVPVPAAQAATPPFPTDGLRTPAQAARRLGVSNRTLRGLVTSGEVRYVNVGRGKQRERVMFTDSDLDDFISNRTRQKAQQSCPSTSQRARRTTTSTSSGEVIAFTARRKEQTNARRKR
jgi:excisionase family DNA binding protein